MGSIPVAGAKVKQPALAVGCFTLTSSRRTHSASVSEAELGSHTKRAHRRACSPVSSAGIFAKSEIPSRCAKHALESVFSLLFDVILQ